MNSVTTLRDNRWILSLGKELASLESVELVSFMGYHFLKTEL